MPITGWLSKVVALPRDPVGRGRWLVGLSGPLLATPLAALMVGWFAVEAVAACAEPVSGACQALSSLAEGRLALVAGGVIVGLGLGLLRARGGRVGWLASLVTAGVTTAGIVAVIVFAAAAGPWLVALGLALGLLVTLVVVGPLWVADTLVAMLAAERRRWWTASLRAARLTRRTLGLGVYRQLCRDGFIRVHSAVHPGRTYLVPRRTSPSGARVLVEEDGRAIGGLCLRPRQPLPDPEEVVAHVLLLRGDERGYLAAANFFPYDTVLTPQATVRRL